MSGALNRAAGRTRTPFRRKRFADGGATDDPWDTDAPGGALSQAPETSSEGTGASGPPGALGQSADPAAARLIRARQNLAAGQNARNILAASQGQQPITQPVQPGAASAPPQAMPQFGASDPSMSGALGAPASGGQWSDATKLAIAGALLSPPGGPGGFTASLGKGLTVGAEMTERERQLQEAAALRRAQMEQTAAIWKGRLGVQQDRADTYADSVQGRLAVQQRMADLKAQGLDETSAYHQAMTELGQGKLGVSQQNADTNRQRTTDQSAAAQQRIDQATQRIQNTEEYRQKVLEMRKRGLDDATINNTMTNAARLSAMTPGLKVGPAVDQVLASRTKIAPTPAQPATPASPSASDPLAAARAAISRGAPRDAVIQRLRDNGINPAGL